MDQLGSIRPIARARPRQSINNFLPMLKMPGNIILASWADGTRPDPSSAWTGLAAANSAHRQFKKILPKQNNRSFILKILQLDPNNYRVHSLKS
jgi:hypothetical protein